MAGVFVPCVVGLSLLTLTVWLSLTLSGVVPKEWYRDEPGSPGERRSYVGETVAYGRHEVSSLL